MRSRVLDFATEIKLYDWMLIIGLMLAPMTGLRVWKIGPAEVLCLLWGLKHYPSRYLDTRNAVFRFFVIFLGSMFVGTIIGLIVAPNELRLSNWPTWIYLAYIALSLYTGLKKNAPEYNELMLNVFAVLAASWYLLLYFYSINVSKAFFGAPLWYHGVRYTGGARNPHQVAVLMCGLTFCFARNAIKRKYTIINLIYTYICIYIILQTESSTGIAALVVGAVTLIYVITIHGAITAEKKAIITVIEIVIALAVSALFFDEIYNYIMEWIMSDRNGAGRINLFSQIGSSILKSPLFGMGPGVHAYNLKGRLMEYHNTYTEIIAATGIVGFTAFLWFTIKMLRNLIFEDLFLPAVVAMYVYGLGGFAMRRLAYWGVFMIIFVIAEEKRNRILKREFNK